MKIISHHTHNKEIEVIELLGDLTGNGALELQNYLHTCLDQGKCFQLINLNKVKKIDGLGINILENFASRGLQIRLFNVGTEIRWMLRISGKEDLFNIYNETDSDKAVSLFEEYISKDTVKESIKKRRYLRINTFIQAEFKYNPHHNGMISVRTNVLNLSEGGILVDQIKASNPETGEIIVQPEITGQELYDLKFTLKNGNSSLIETKGECVREIKTHEKFCSGICFKDIKQEYRKQSRDYISKACNYSGG